MKLTADLPPKLTAVDFDPFTGGELFACVPATESQKEIWIAVQMGNEANCAYNESMCLRLQGNLNVESLRFSIQELVQRHEALRATFSPDGSTLCIASAIELDIPLIDLSIVDDRDRESKLAYLRREEVDRPFNLVNGAKLAVFPAGSPSLAELAEAIRLYKVTILWLTAGLFHLMVDDRIT